MAEIKTPIVALTEGEPYTPKAGDYLITEKHNLSDILRFCVEQSDLDEVEVLVRQMRAEADSK